MLHCTHPTGADTPPAGCSPHSQGSLDGVVACGNDDASYHWLVTDLVATQKAMVHATAPLHGSPQTPPVPVWSLLPEADWNSPDPLNLKPQSARSLCACWSKPATLPQDHWTAT